MISNLLSLKIKTKSRMLKEKQGFQDFLKTLNKNFFSRTEKYQGKDNLKSTSMILD